MPKEGTRLTNKTNLPVQSGIETRVKRNSPETRYPRSPLIQLQRHLGNHAFQSFYASGLIQPKLKINEAEDKYEREAERVAEVVMRVPEPRMSDEALPSILGRGANGTIQRRDSGGAARRPAPPPAREVIAIRLGHGERGGLGRFDTLLYRDCSMKVQFRMNFTFLGEWPNTREQRDWQRRYVETIRRAWSRQYDLEAVGDCASPCARVTPFVAIYAPHNNPHVNVDVTRTENYIQSTAGYGVAHLDSLDLTPIEKRAGVEEQVPAVHEFGHLVGRSHSQIAECGRDYPEAGVMCFGNTVTEADYEPFAHALGQMTRCTYRVVPRRQARPSSLPVRTDFNERLIQDVENL